MAAGISLPPRQGEQHATKLSQHYKFTMNGWERLRYIWKITYEISFTIALQGLPFTALRSQVETGKLHRVNFMGSYVNETACKTFIWTQSLILHKMLTFTGTLNLSRFRENWDVVVTNEFHRV